MYHPKKNCICTEREIEKYRKKISGPLLDRIDISIEVPVVDVKDLSGNQNINKSLESSENIRKRVLNARKIQNQRLYPENIYTNAEMGNKQIRKYCFLSGQVEKILVQATAKFCLSARAYFKTIKIARTIADLDSSENIDIVHMAEALQYRYRENETNTF